MVITSYNYCPVRARRFRPLASAKGSPGALGVAPGGLGQPWRTLRQGCRVGIPRRAFARPPDDPLDDRGQAKEVVAEEPIQPGQAIASGAAAIFGGQHVDLGDARCGPVWQVVD